MKILGFKDCQADVVDKKDFRFLICGLAKRVTFEKQ